MSKTRAAASIFILFSISLFSQDSTFVIGKIIIEGNKITKTYIVQKELTFNTGDTLSAANFEIRAVQSTQNLLNTGLFNFADVRPMCDSSGTTVVVALKERWYTWPQPSAQFEDRNFFDWWQYKTLDRLSYGLYLNQYNMWGRRETMEIKLKFGYSQEIGLLYKIPYLIKTKDHGLNFSFLSIKRHEIYYKSTNDKITYLKDVNAIMRNEFNAFIDYTYRSKLYQTHSLRVDYDAIQVQDTIVSANENPNYLGNGRNRAAYFSLHYMYKKDRRDSKNYPLLGYDYDIEIKQYGLNFSSKKINTTSLTCTAEYFTQLKGRFYLASGLRAKVFSTSSVPFYIAHGLGFAPDYVRGYEPYLISGSNFIIVKSNLKYQVMKPRVFKIPYLPFEKFNTFHFAIYLNALLDFGYIRDFANANANALSNNLLMGYGMGLDFVTYYDKVLRIEYSINKKGLSGIYLSFIAPI
jgi:outer membrane protein assembly factor BamA